MATCRLPAATLVLLLAGPVSVGAQERFTPEQEERLGECIREYLLKNPEVVLEALRELDRRRAAARTASSVGAIRSNEEEIFRPSTPSVGGNPDGNIALVEFFDYNCPYCRAVKSMVFDLLRRDGKIRLIDKEFPILGDSSVFAAKAALAAARQNPELYEQFHIRLLESKGRLTDASVLAAAEEIGLDVARLRTDMADSRSQAEIERSIALARRLGISGTPAFVVGDQILNGAQSGAALRRAIRKARQGS